MEPGSKKLVSPFEVGMDFVSGDILGFRDDKIERFEKFLDQFDN